MQIVKFIVLVIACSTILCGQSVLLNPSSTQTVTQPAGTTLNVNRLGNVRYADQFPGADACAKINAAVADLPASGGVVDARAFLGVLPVCASGIVLNKPLQLVLGVATLKSAASPVVLISSSSVAVNGAGSGSSIIQQTTSTGNVVQINPGLTHVAISNVGLIAPPLFSTNLTTLETSYHEGDCLLAGSGGGLDPSTAFSYDINLDGITCATGNNGVVFRYVQMSRISNSLFSANVPGLASVLLVNADYVAVTHNTFTDAGKSANAVYLRPNHPDTVQHSNFNTISANTIAGSYAFEAITAAGAANVISNNTIQLYGGAANTTGIHFLQPGPGSIADTASETTDNVASNNTISIFSTGQSTGCFFTADDTSSLGVWRSTVTGNTCTTNSGFGFILGAFSRNSVLTGNSVTVAGTTFQLDCFLVVGSGAADNLLIGSSCIGATANAFDASSSTRTRMIGNQTFNTVGASGSAYFVATGATDVLLSNNSAVSCNRGVGVQSATGSAVSNQSLSCSLPDLFGSMKVLDTQGMAFSNLPAAANGSFIYCSDCAIAPACSGAGGGAFAKRIGGAWVCN